MSGYFAMGGYAAYVWTAYGFAAVVLGALAASSWRARARALAALDAAEADGKRRGGRT